MSQPGGDDDADDASEAARLFRDAVRGVKPLAGGTHAPRRPKPRAHARFTRADRAAVLKESLAAEPHDPALAGGEELLYQRPGVQAAVVRRLRRGEYTIEREIDLHGLTVAEAKHALRQFLIDALERGVRCVRIVHGKGLRSGHRGPVLKAAVSAVLRRTGAVLAYVSARPADGGTGALYVLLSPA
ncbi:MAG TPA: Smr/MutS family protein [Steroidobacteraceae bacterium]|nr:Smr/MutS family protein [Steroidobacteraceae bacterium]